MSYAPSHPALAPGETLPPELLELWERVQALPREVRSELEPLIVDAVEESRFRSRVLNVARDALEQFKLDLDMARFDLDATRRERETLLRILNGGTGLEAE
jgi:hypothetical protein